MLRRDERQNGFTLIELFIVVAIMGILAALAIPAFMNHQNTSKRAEAFANLSQLGKAQKAFFAEFGAYEFVLAEPSGVTGKAPGIEKRPFSGVSTFDIVGWNPEGEVYFDYDTNTPGAPNGASDCSCNVGCFTAAAYGDLDGRNGQSVLVYAHPDQAGDYCVSAIFGKSPPTNRGDLRFDEVVRVVDSDFY